MVILPMEFAIIDNNVSDKSTVINNPVNPLKESSKTAPAVLRDSAGRLMKGSKALNPAGRPKSTLTVLSDDVKTLVISEVTRILGEGEGNKNYQPVLLKVMDKAMPSLKAIEMRGEQINQLGVIVLPTKKPIDIDEVRVDNPHFTEEEG
jgi:hypothetical protein